MWFGGKMILEKGYTGGDVINVIFAIVTGSMALGEVSPCITTAFVTGQAAAFKMFEAIERKPKIDAFLSDGKRFNDVRGEIELRDVDFSYPWRRHQQIFCGFSLIIPSRTTTALVGGSGSGKSTVISLIERFYDPDAGEVLIDGVNLKEFQLKWIRQKISLVSRDLLLLSGKIYCSHFELMQDLDGVYSQLIRSQTNPNMPDQIEAANTHEPRIIMDPGRSSGQSPFQQLFWSEVSPPLSKEKEKKSLCYLTTPFERTLHYGNEDKVTEAEIVAAAELANGHKFICSLEQGYDAIVGERGIQLSGGQKQRVAIVRAIIKTPKILLLDEATSALDAESESFVQEALDKAAVNRTTVVVAHLLSTITCADLIAMVKNGGIAEIGSHESLVNREDGIYASFLALQSGDEPK